MPVLYSLANHLCVVVKTFIMATTTSSLAATHLKELEAEAVATRKCLEKIPGEKFDFKPHPTSMNLGYLSLLVAEIPLWIAQMVEKGEIDLAKFEHGDPKDNKGLLQYYDENMNKARKALSNATDADMERTFHLKANGQTMFSEKTSEYIGPTINHWVHHRGQLTVYMRISELKVPAIYGPSGDDKAF